MRYKKNITLTMRTITGIFLLLLTFSTAPLLADTPPNPERQNLQQEIVALEETIKILTDEKQRNDLVLQLEALLDAKKQTLALKTRTTPVEPQEQTINLVRIYQRMSQKIQTLSGNLEKKFSQLPKEYEQIRLFFSKKENISILLDIVIKIIILIIISALLFLFSRKLALKWKISYQKRKTLSLSGKVETLLFNIFLESYYLAILYILSWLFLRLIIQNIIASGIIYILGAFFIYQVGKSFCRLVLCPKNPEDRLFRIDDQLANYILIWCHRVLLFSLWIFILTKLTSLFGLNRISGIFLGIYQIGLLIMLAIILAQWKESIQKGLSSTLSEKDPVWIIKAKNTYNYLIGKVYLALIIYFSGIVLTYILGYRKTYQYLLYSTTWSFLAIALAIIFWFLWNALFQKLFAISNEIKQRYPALEKQVNQYITWIDKLAHFFIILFTLFIILATWGVDIRKFLTSYSSYIYRLIRIPLIIVIAFSLIQVITFLIQKMIDHITESRKKKDTAPSSEIEKQMATIGGILRKSLLIAIWFITGMMVLKELGFSIGPLLAGAGIVGVAVGFGSQNLVRDIISGLFMIIENQIRVGDVAILNGTGGLVENVNLRTTVLRGLDGTVHIFPNGNISTVSNMTHDFSYYLFDIGVAYKEDVDRVCAVLMEISDQIIQEEPYQSSILAPLEILGLDKFADSAVIIKARIKTKPIMQWQVGREMNRRIKIRFDEEGIEIPFPHRTFYFGEVSKPVDLKMKVSKKDSENIKEFIRTTIVETIAEGKEKEKQKGKNEKDLEDGNGEKQKGSRH